MTDTSSSTTTDLSQVLVKLLPKCDCSDTCNNNNTNKHRHDSIIIEVLRNRTLLRRIINVGRPIYWRYSTLKYDQLNRADDLLRLKRHYVLVERLLRCGNNSISWSIQGLMLLIELMPFAVFKHVYDSNRYIMLYYHRVLMSTAAKYGRLDMFKIFEAQVQDFPPGPQHSYQSSSDDHLILALHNNRQAVFDHLLARETKQSMDRRLTNWSNIIPPNIGLRSPDDWREMAAILKTLVIYIETHYKKLTQGQYVITRLLGDCQFMLVLLCQDMDLARLSIKYFPFNDEELTNSFNLELLNYDDLKGIPIDPEQLGRKVDFIFDLLELHKRPATRTVVEWPACREVLNDVGVMLLDIFSALTQNYDTWIVIRRIFMNVRQDANQSELAKFVQYFISRDMTTHQLFDGLTAISTYGTLEMVKLAMDIVGRSLDGKDLSNDDSFPKSVEILEYLVQHNLYTMRTWPVIVHFASLGDPDQLRKLFSTFPTLLIDNQTYTADDLRVYQDEIMEALENHSVDTCISIQSIIQAELAKANRNADFKIVTVQAYLSTLQQVQSLSDDKLRSFEYYPNEEVCKVDPSVIISILSRASDIILNKHFAEGLMESACTYGLIEYVHLLDSSSNQVFKDIRSDSDVMANLLLAAYNHGQYSIFQYLVGCGARLKWFMWKRIIIFDNNSIMLLDMLLDQQQTTLTQSEKEVVIHSLCSNPDSSLIKMVYRRWSKDIKLDRDILVQKAFKCMTLDRVDVLASITEMIVDCSRLDSNN
ncbi:hypothetical protein SAMD00019534_030290, partial [Acytostelium subglobosum LB1]|uniref:hypothetical protein n=1 Tax=Acytostelium subglobosum LB1 TaxID=1410327 RepID=UPI000644F97F